MGAIPVVLGVCGVYLAVGGVASLWFLFAGVKRVDPNPMTWGARVVLFPGCCALWTVLVAKAARGRRP
ncbi:MAG: hypothetical protein Tsb0013_10910 [Phycisphaerales bacterium]